MSDRDSATEVVRASLVTRYVGEARTEAEQWFDRWLASVKADAWDDGCKAGRLHEAQERRGSETRIILDNPHRKEGGR